MSEFTSDQPTGEASSQGDGTLGVQASTSQKLTAENVQLLEQHSEENSSLGAVHGRDLSPECMEVQALDGRAVFKTSTATQTYWEWAGRELLVENDSHSSECVALVPEYELQLQEKEKEIKKGNISGPEEIEIVAGSSSDSSVEQLEGELDAVLCEYCQQARQAVVTRQQLANVTAPEELFCCELAWRMAVFLMEEEEASTLESVKIDFGPLLLFHSGAKTQAKKRLKEWVSQSSPQSRPWLSRKPRVKRNTICYRLSDEPFTAAEGSELADMEIITPHNAVTLSAVGNQEKSVLTRHYQNGLPYITIFPDGTGHVFYPSGRLAVLISLVQACNFTYIVMEDRAIQSSIQAVLTSKGHATCYHPSGVMWVNTTQLGGVCFTETGALRRRWSWLDPESHVHAPPFQPVCARLGAHVDICFRTFECVHLTFSQQENSVSFNAGAKIKAQEIMLPAPDPYETLLQERRVKIHSLLEKIRASRSLQRSPVPAHFSLLAQSQRLQTTLNTNNT